MPDDWVHCLFTGSIIGADYEFRHCWVNQLLDYPAGFLGGHHRILLHDLETAKKLGGCCWWAGFVAALHIDIDNASAQIRSQLENVVRPIRGNTVDETELKKEREDLSLTSVFLRNLFLKIHEKIGISVLMDDKASLATAICIHPDTLLKTTWDYVSQSPPKGARVDGHPFNELPSDVPRIIRHPDLGQLETPAHVAECLNPDWLKRLFHNAE